MTTAAFATVATFDLDLDREAEQRAGLEQVILPSVRQAPGFVSGTWTLDRRLCQSTVVVLFDSTEAAEAFTDSVRLNAPNQEAVGISLREIRVVEVTAVASQGQPREDEAPRP